MRVAGVASTRAVLVPFDLPGACAALTVAVAACVAVSAAAAPTCASALPDFAVAAGVAEVAAPSVSIVTSTLPTGQSWPSAYMRLATRPARGDGISTVALSVMTSTIGWSSRERVALLDLPADDLALDDAFADVGQLELEGHADPIGVG